MSLFFTRGHTVSSFYAPFHVLQGQYLYIIMLIYIGGNYEVKVKGVNIQINIYKEVDMKESSMMA